MEVLLHTTNECVACRPQVISTKSLRVKIIIELTVVCLIQVLDEVTQAYCWAFCDLISMFDCFFPIWSTNKKNGHCNAPNILGCVAIVRRWGIRYNHSVNFLRICHSYVREYSDQTCKSDGQYYRVSSCTSEGRCFRFISSGPVTDHGYIRPF